MANFLQAHTDSILARKACHHKHRSSDLYIRSWQLQVQDANNKLTRKSRRGIPVSHAVIYQGLHSLWHAAEGCTELVMLQHGGEVTDWVRSPHFTCCWRCCAFKGEGSSAGVFSLYLPFILDYLQGWTCLLNMQGQMFICQIPLGHSCIPPCLNSPSDRAH